MIDGAALLERVLASYFSAGVAYDFPALERFLRHPGFPGREAAFRGALADAIVRHRISPAAFEAMTAIDQDSQADVDAFLRREVWDSLYPGEAPEAAVTAARTHRD